MKGESPAALPQEIIDAIIDQVAPPRQLEYIRSSNTPSLRACALVSKSFLPRSQKNIFRQIILCPPAKGHSTGRNTPDRLHAVIQSSPWLSSSVESVIISCVDGTTLANTAGVHNDAGSFQEDPEVWLLHNQLLLPLQFLFDSFTRLSSFSLASTLFAAHVLRLYTAEIMFYAGLCRGHRIETVRFIGVFVGNRRLVTKILLLFPDMKTLFTTSAISSTSTLQDIVVDTTLFEECSDDSPDDVDDSSHHLCSLRHLHLASAHVAELEGLVNRPFPLQVDRLHSMHLAASDEMASAGDFLREVGQLLEAARCLVHLTLDLMEASDIFWDHADRPVLPFHRLTTLTLWIQSGPCYHSLLFSPSPVNTCLFYVRSLSTSPAYPSCLEHVSFAIRVSDATMPERERVTWEDFAEAIMRPEFPRMRSLSFTLSAVIENIPPEDCEHVSDGGVFSLAF